MPLRLRPSNDFASDAICVGDPGRALLLAQELLVKPLMSNHARGLWGYTGMAKEGDTPLTIQATGMGAASAAIVLEDLAELGVRRVVRVGTCLVLDADIELGEVLVVEGALCKEAISAELEPSGVAMPDRVLLEGLGSGRRVTVSSGNRLTASGHGSAEASSEAKRPPAVADLQTAAVLAVAKSLGIAAAALLIAERDRADGILSDDALEAASRMAGRAGARTLST